MDRSVKEETLWKQPCEIWLLLRRFLNGQLAAAAEPNIPTSIKHRTRQLLREP
jgi:hypothetical protein